MNFRFLSDHSVYMIKPDTLMFMNSDHALLFLKFIPIFEILSD